MDRSLICLFAIIGLLGCEKTAEMKIEEFNEIILLDGQLSNDIIVMSKGNVNLCVIDTFLVIQKSKEKFFSIYGTNSHNLLAEYGDSGSGPDEFMDPVLLKQITYDSENKSPVITIYDYQRMRLNFINIVNLVEKEGVIHRQELLPEGNPYLTYFYFKNDGFLLGAPESDARFFHHNYGSNKAKVIPYVPEMAFSINEEYLHSVYRSAVAVNEDKGLIVAAPLLLGGIDFFDLDGNYLKSTFFDAPEKLEKEINSSRNLGIFDPFHYIVDIDSKGDLIYGLNYNNRSTSLNDANNPLKPKDRSV